MDSALAWPLNWLRSEEVVGSGATTQDQRALADFDRVTVNIPVVVEIRPGSNNHIVISGDKNILDVIDATVKDGRLSVSAPNKRIKPSRPVLITIETKNLRAVSVENGATVSATKFPSSHLDASVSGGGSLKLDALSLDALNLSIAGEGSFSGTGKVGSFAVSAVGRGVVEAGQLEAQKVSASVSGMGSVVVWVVDGMNVQTIGPGTVKYYGDAVVSGKAERLGSRPVL